MFLFCHGANAIAVWSMTWTRLDVSAWVEILNLNLVVNLTSLQRTWLMLLTPWQTHQHPPFSTDLTDAVASMGLKDAPTSIWWKVTEANMLLKFKIEPKMINCNLCSFNILWRTWTFFSMYRNLKTPTTTQAERKQKNWTLLGQNTWVKRTLHCTDFRMVWCLRFSWCMKKMWQQHKTIIHYIRRWMAATLGVLFCSVCVDHRMNENLGVLPVQTSVRQDAFTSWARLIDGHPPK